MSKMITVFKKQFVIISTFLLFTSYFAFPQTQSDADTLFYEGKILYMNYWYEQAIERFLAAAEKYKELGKEMSFTASGLRPVSPPSWKRPRRGFGIWLEHPLWNKSCTMYMFCEVLKTVDFTRVPQETWKRGLKRTIEPTNRARKICCHLNGHIIRRARVNMMRWEERSIWNQHMVRGTWKTDWKIMAAYSTGQRPVE